MLFDNYQTHSLHDPTIFSIALTDGPARRKSSIPDSPRRSNRSKDFVFSAEFTQQDEDDLDEQISAIEAQIAKTERHKRYLQHGRPTNGPPVTLDFDPSTDDEYRLFVSSDIVLDPKVSSSLLNAPGSPELRSFDEEDSLEGGSPAFSAQGKARPARKCKRDTTTFASPATQQKRKASNGNRKQDSVTTIDFSFDSISSAPSDEEFEQFNIEISEVDKRTRECVTTVITAVTPISSNSKTKRKSVPSNTTNVNKDKSKSPAKRTKKSGKDVNVVNFINAKEKLTRLPSFQGEEILRISVVEVENEEVDILN